MSFDGKSNHYDGKGLEVIDVIDAFDLDFYLGNVVKYICRHGKKGDQRAALGDLKKASQYLTRLIERIEREQGEP